MEEKVLSEIKSLYGQIKNLPEGRANAYKTLQFTKYAIGSLEKIPETSSIAEITKRTIEQLKELTQKPFELYRQSLTEGKEHGNDDYYLRFTQEIQGVLETWFYEAWGIAS